MGKLEDSVKESAFAREITREPDLSLHNKKQNCGKERQLKEKSK